MEKEIMLQKIKVGDIRNLLISEPSTVTPDTTINEVLEKINEDLRTRHIYVVDKENKLIGSVRMNTIVKYLFPLSAVIHPSSEDLHDVDNINLNGSKASEIMNPKPSYVLESTNLTEMAKILLNEKINELPVVDRDMKIVGQVNVYELIQAYLEKSNITTIPPDSLLHLIV